MSAGKSFLDDFREEIRRWSEGLWVEDDRGRGGFRSVSGSDATLIASTDVAWIRYAVNDTEIDGSRREKWIRWLQDCQDPARGQFAYRPETCGHSPGHAFWHSVRALRILGADVKHFPEYLRPLATPDGLVSYFDGIDWSSSRSNHHDVLGLVPLMVSRNDPQLIDVFYAKLAEQQDADSGTWPGGRPANISRTFAYSVLHMAAGRTPPRAERIVDAILSLQDGDGFWRGPGFLTMDSCFLLVRLAPEIGYRTEAALTALERLDEAMESIYRARMDQYLGDTHRTLAICHTYGFLQEAFGGKYPSERPYRFDWDNTEIYRSDVIASGL